MKHKPMEFEKEILNKYIYVIQYKGPKAIDYSLIALGDSFKAVKKFIRKHHKRATKLYKMINHSFKWDSNKDFTSTSEEINPNENYLKTRYGEIFIPNKCYLVTFAYKRITEQKCYGFGTISYRIYRFNNDQDGIIEF